MFHNHLKLNKRKLVVEPADSESDVYHEVARHMAQAPWWPRRNVGCQRRLPGTAVMVMRLRRVGQARG